MQGPQLGGLGLELLHNFQHVDYQGGFFAAFNKAQKEAGMCSGGHGNISFSGFGCIEMPSLGAELSNEGAISSQLGKLGGNGT